MLTASVGKRGPQPRQDRTTVRATRLQVLLTANELADLQARAREAGRTVASYVRVLLGLEK